ncbi:MAG: heavy metal translocating P-type ATPase [Chloroflexota bacterium]
MLRSRRPISSRPKLITLLEKDKSRGEPLNQPTNVLSLSNILDRWRKGHMSEEEKTSYRYLAIATGLTGMAGMGVLVYYPLIWIAIPGFLYISIPEFKRAYAAMKRGQATIDTLLSISILTAFSTNFVFLMGLTFVLYHLGEILMHRVKNTSQQSVIDVFRQYPRFAWVKVDDIDVKIAVEQLKQGDIVLVGAGGVIPVDGTIIAGIAAIDQHILTGEAQQAEKEVGDQVFASTIVLSGNISIKVEKAGQETTVARIGQILNDTIDFKSEAHLRAETMANQTVAPTLLLSAFCFPFVGASGALAVMQSHFNSRMSLVAPVSILTYFNLMSTNGILIKDGRTLDFLNDIDTIVFDKTGTLTQEQPHVGQIFVTPAETPNESTVVRAKDVLLYAAAAEQKQTHPIANAIIEEAHKQGIDIPTIDGAEYQVGYGLIVMFNDQLVHVGSRRFMTMVDIAIPRFIQQAQESCHRQGHSLVMVAVDHVLMGGIELMPTVRPEAKQVLCQLRKRKNIQATYIVSGDHVAPTKKLAAELGVDSYFAETLPENKAELIDQLQHDGKSVCFIGDGINDSIALKKAHVSISLRGASTAATDTAQIILMDESLGQLNNLFDIAADFHQNMNIGFLSLLVPTVIGMGGTLFFHFGFLHAVVLTQIGLVVGILNGVRPRLAEALHRQTQQQLQST